MNRCLSVRLLVTEFVLVCVCLFAGLIDWLFVCLLVGWLVV